MKKLTHELIEATVGGHEAIPEGIWRFNWRGVDCHIREVAPGKFHLVCDGHLVGSCSTLFEFVDLLGYGLQIHTRNETKKRLLEEISCL